MKKILVIEQERVMRALYEDELSEAGYHVLARGDGEALLGLIETERPHVVLLDSRAGKDCARDLLNDIRDAFGDLPIILNKACGAMVEGARPGLEDYCVEKRSDFRDLMGKVRLALSRDRTRVGPRFSGTPSQSGF